MSAIANVPFLVTNLSTDHGAFISYERLSSDPYWPNFGYEGVGYLDLNLLLSISDPDQKRRIYVDHSRSRSGRGSKPEAE
jgi:hypothetical protein